MSLRATLTIHIDQVKRGLRPRAPDRSGLAASVCSILIKGSPNSEADGAMEVGHHLNQSATSLDWRRETTFPLVMPFNTAISLRMV